jgi:hypothetical protein
VASRKFPSFAGLVLLSAGLFFSPGAQGAPSAADKETARALMDDGDKKFAAGDLQGALKSYKAADDIMKVPTTALEVARAQIKLKLLVEARDTLVRLMAIPTAPNESGAFAKARQEAAWLNEELVTRIPSLRVGVEGLGVGVSPEVTIDGEALPVAAVGLPRKLNPGLRRVVVSAKGYQSATAEVTLAEGENKELSVALRLILLAPVPSTSAAPPPPPATSTTPSPPPPPSTPPATVTVPTSIPTAGIRHPALVYGGFGLGLLGVSFGVISGVIALNKASELEKKCPGNVCDEPERGAIVSTKNWALASNLGFAVGIAGAGVGVVALLVGARTPSTAARSVEPVVGLNHLGLRGQF